MFRPEKVFDDGAGHYFMRQKQNIIGNGFSHTIDTRFSTGWSGFPLALQMSSSLKDGLTTLSLAVDGNDSEYRSQLSQAKQVTTVSAHRLLENVVMAQREEGAGLDEPLATFTERSLSRLVLAHIIQQRGFTLAHHNLARTLVSVVAFHTPSDLVISHPAFSVDVFSVNTLENSALM